MVSTVEVLAVGAEGVPPLTLTAQVEGREVEFVEDTGSPVSLLPRHLVHGDLRAPELSLRAYDGHLLNVLGVASVYVSWGGRGMEGCVYVVPEGRALMGRDLISKCQVCIVGDRVCAVSTDSSSHQSGPAPQPASSPTCAPPAGQPDCPSGAQPILESQHPVTADPGTPPACQPLRRLPLAAVGEVSADSGGRWEQREGEVSVVTDAVSVETAALSRATAVAEEEPPRQATRPPDGPGQRAVAVVHGTSGTGPGTDDGRPVTRACAPGAGFGSGGRRVEDQGSVRSEELPVEQLPGQGDPGEPTIPDPVPAPPAEESSESRATPVSPQVPSEAPPCPQPLCGQVALRRGRRQRRAPDR